MSWKDLPDQPTSPHFGNPKFESVWTKILDRLSDWGHGHLDSDEMKRKSLAVHTDWYMDVDRQTMDTVLWLCDGWICTARIIRLIVVFYDYHTPRINIKEFEGFIKILSCNISCESAMLSVQSHEKRWPFQSLILHHRPRSVKIKMAAIEQTKWSRYFMNFKKLSKWRYAEVQLVFAMMLNWCICGKIYRRTNLE